MEAHRIEELLNGAEPSLEDYASYISVIEKLPIELLWKAINSAPNMNPILKSATSKVLQEKVPRHNIDIGLESIAEKFRLRTQGL